MRFIYAAAHPASELISAYFNIRTGILKCTPRRDNKEFAVSNCYRPRIRFSS